MNLDSHHKLIRWRDDWKCLISIPLMASHDDSSTIEVPECTYQISDTDMTSLKLAIDPLQQSNEYGIDIYENTLQFINML